MDAATVQPRHSMTLQPDNALLCHCETGLEPVPAPLAEMLTRHDILLRSGGYSRQFDEMIRRLCAEIQREPDADPHRLWPSRSGGLILAVMRWNASYCTVHVYEEPAPTAEQRLLAKLTGREIEVLHWLAQGKTNAIVAAILGISEATVRKHVQRLLAKLQRDNRTAAVALLNALWAHYARH